MATYELDRSEINRALAKAIAYKACGKTGLANEWAIKLVKLLQCHNILSDAAQAEWEEGTAQ